MIAAGLRNHQKMNVRRLIMIILMVLMLLLLTFYWLSHDLGALETIVKWRFQAVNHIKPKKLHKQIQSGSPLLLIDSRELSEFQVSQIPGAIHIASHDPDRLQKLKALIQSQPEPHQVIFYCSIGWRSSQLVTELKQVLSAEKGENLHNLQGSIFRWANEGYDLVDHGQKPTHKVHPYGPLWEGLLVAPAEISYESQGK